MSLLSGGLPLPYDFGRYTLLARIGGGGMATVYRATYAGVAGFEKELALKVVRPELAEDPSFVQMFLEEARLAARLNHANVVQTFDFGEVEGVQYLAMELVRGGTLSALLRSAREEAAPLEIVSSLFVAKEIARALDYAHRLVDGDGSPLGLIHRDVSPQNVLVSAEGEVKLADFGIAKAALRSQLTLPGRVRGKCAYMAPEQARGAELDPRADVFALGAVLWECLCGESLFAGSSDAETLLRVIEKEVPPPSRLRPEIPEDVDRAVLRMLERDVERRPTSAEVALRLGELLLEHSDSLPELRLADLQRRFGSARPAAPEPLPTRVLREVRPDAETRLSPARGVERTTRGEVSDSRTMVGEAAGSAALSIDRTPVVGGEGRATAPVSGSLPMVPEAASEESTYVLSAKTRPRVAASDSRFRVAAHRLGLVAAGCSLLLVGLLLGARAWGPETSVLAAPESDVPAAGPERSVADAVAEPEEKTPASAAPLLPPEARPDAPLGLGATMARVPNSPVEHVNPSPRSESSPEAHPPGPQPSPPSAPPQRSASTRAPGVPARNKPPATPKDRQPPSGAAAAPTPAASPAESPSRPPPSARLVLSTRLPESRVRIGSGEAVALESLRPVALDLPPGEHRLSFVASALSRSCTVSVRLREGDSLALHLSDGGVHELRGSERRGLSCD